MKKRNDRVVLHSSETTEWYTPAPYINLARAAMGNIDLDPASCAFANRVVKANYFYTVEDNGLVMPWFGRLWLNPPYGFTNGKSNQALWSAKLLREYRAGNVQQAILLVNATPGEKWFGRLWNYPVCFMSQRIQFYNEQGVAPGGATHSNAAFYLGEFESDKDRFATLFTRVGTVVERYKIKSEGR